MRAVEVPALAQLFDGEVQRRRREVRARAERTRHRRVHRGVPGRVVDDYIVVGNRRRFFSRRFKIVETVHALFGDFFEPLRFGIQKLPRYFLQRRDDALAGTHASLLRNAGAVSDRSPPLLRLLARPSRVPIRQPHVFFSSRRVSLRRRVIRVRRLLDAALRRRRRVLITAAESTARVIAPVRRRAVVLGPRARAEAVIDLLRLSRLRGRRSRRVRRGSRPARAPSAGRARRARSAAAFLDGARGRVGAARSVRGGTGVFVVGAREPVSRRVRLRVGTGAVPRRRGFRRADASRGVRRGAARLVAAGVLRAERGGRDVRAPRVARGLAHRREPGRGRPPPERRRERVGRRTTRRDARRRAGAAGVPRFGRTAPRARDETRGETRRRRRERAVHRHPPSRLPKWGGGGACRPCGIPRHG